MVPLRVTRPPELVQIARERPGCAHDDVPWSGRFVDRADDRALRRRRLLHRVEPRDLGVPLGVQLLGLRAIALVDDPLGAGERLEAGPRIAEERNAAELVRVDRRDVEVQEPHARVGEEALRCRREVRPSRADPDDQIRLARHAVRGKGAGRADRAQRERMVVRQRSLPGLRLRDRDPAALGEASQRVGRAAVDDATAGDDERPPGRVDELDRASERRGVRRAAVYMPDTLRKELVGHFEDLGLDVLRQRERHRTGLGLVGEHAHRVQRRRDDLLGARDPIPVLRHRLERVVHAGVPARRDLELL